jgi:hypothetical protein
MSELAGDFRAPHNAFQQASGASSIHNDTVASKLGFKGGTIPGSVHMDQFVPLLLQVYGRRWFETGDMSLFFTQATIDQEKVRAVVQPGEGRAKLTMYNEADDLICEGTASDHAPDDGAELRRRILKQEPAQPGRLRILADVAVGDETSDIPLIVTEEQLAASLRTITEPLALYGDEKILPPSHLVRLAHMSRSTVLARSKSSVGLFGALEVRQYAGPLYAGRDYVGRTRMLKLSESPRTENCWYDVIIADPATGRDVACVQFLIRMMKASSPLWAEKEPA